MTKLILELISKLDSNNDALLIGLLHQKLENINTKFNVSDKEIDLKCTPLSYSYSKYFETDLIKNRIKKLESKIKSCITCKNQTQKHNYTIIFDNRKYTFQKECKLNSDEYINCKNYQQKLERLITELSDKPIENARKYLINNEISREIIKTKIILSKLNLKLKNYDASKH